MTTESSPTAKPKPEDHAENSRAKERNEPPVDETDDGPATAPGDTGEN